MNRIKLLFFTITVSVIICSTTSFTLAADRGKVTASNADIVGSGATFPNPLYQRWIKEFTKIHPEFTIFYDSVGSGEGTKRFMAQTVDFGASDSAMTDEQIAQVKQGVQLVPMTAGSIVLAYNLPNIPEGLRLSREVYTDIFLGTITSWDDKRIQQLNPHCTLPKLHIITVSRSDSSGTTWAFTNHLQTISRKWHESGYTAGKKIDWPGNSMVSRYNEGVAGAVKVSLGSIGYVEYGIAKRAGLAMAALENRSGEFISPSDTSGTITLANSSAQMPENLRMFLSDPEGKDSYPIVTYTWLLLYKSYPDPDKARKIQQFVTWGLTHGQQYAAEYGYIPLPGSVVSAAQKGLANVH
jgi:phosphate transport system substrate-binding protein